ncbi:TetR/AcrR family transcriptional regulator [Paenibacillus sp. N3.4]|uniref:TetR/AcrR family transcriptional regulator n=1 Tax=Paenibacillus sp. N3.4 TaxID=2603222 RepID=UPI0011CB84D2|nr:TetR/AcrR family transcriptional regulator [Paenibacillus sp. N3.4]TXK84396.1 TetR/AcrR family transcriptional regulator [Paenibacillus sp. N3.4]
MKPDNFKKDDMPSQPVCKEPSCGRREERNSEYRNRILATAQSLCNKQQIETVTMYQIAQEAGVGQGTLYRRYSHIGEIYTDLLHTTTSQFINSLESSLSAPEEGKALNQLANIIRRIIDFVDEKANILSVITSVHTEKHSFTLHKKPIFVRLRSIMETLIQQAIDQGEIQELDVTLTVNALIASLSPEQYLYHREILGYNKERFTAGICRLFVKGI